MKVDFPTSIIGIAVLVTMLRLLQQDSAQKNKETHLTVHTNVVSSTGDFTLRYTIFVTPPPVTGVNRQFDSNAFLNQTQQNNTFASNKID